MKKKKIESFIISVISFIIGFGIAFIVLSVIVGLFGLLNGDGTMAGIVSVIVLLMSIAFGLAVALSKPKGKTGGYSVQRQQEETQIIQSEDTTQNSQTLENDQNTKTNRYRVAGVTHYIDSIMKLSYENEEYSWTKRELVEAGYVGEKIWKYDFFANDIELVPEPGNPYDHNAIKVIADGKHIGYIKSGSCSHLLKCVEDQRIIGISCEIGGGPFLYVDEDYDDEKDKEIYTVEHEETPIYAELSIVERRVDNN